MASSSNQIRKSRSQIPTNQLRKSRSQSQIPRVSVRCILFESKPSSYSRSVSADTRISFIPKKSLCASTESLNKCGTTPQYSNKKVFDSRKISDKNWQKTNWNKVVSYFAAKDIKPHQLKPLSNAMFVNSMNILFKEVDNRLEFTMANYKVEVPANLKLLNYPAQVSAQTMNSVGVPHSFPKILAIWSWLIDKITFLNEDMAHSFGKPQFAAYHEIITAHFANKFLETRGDNISTEHTIEKQFEQLLGLDDDEIKKLETACSNLEKEIEMRDEVLDDLSNKQKNLEENKDEYNNCLEHYKNINEEIIKTESIIKKIEIENVENHEQIKELKETVQNQKYKQHDKLKLENEIKTLKQVNLKVSERLYLCSNRMTEYDLQLDKLIKSLTEVIYEVNNKIRELASIDPNLRQVLIRESAFHREDMMDEILKVLKIKEDILNECDKEAEKNKEIIKKYRKKGEEQNNFKEMCERQELLKKQLEIKFENFESRLKKSLDEEQNQYWQIMDEYNNIGPIADLNDERLSKLIELKNEKKKLEEAVNKLIVDSVNFFKVLEQQNLEINNYVLEKHNAFIRNNNLKDGI